MDGCVGIGAVAVYGLVGIGAVAVDGLVGKVAVAMDGRVGIGEAGLLVAQRPRYAGEALECVCVACLHVSPGTCAHAFSMCLGANTRSRARTHARARARAHTHTHTHVIHDCPRNCLT